MHGRGVLFIGSSHIYFGEFDDGKANGNGLLLANDNSVTVCNFINGLPEGSDCTFIYPSGHTFRGEVLNGRANGLGSINYLDGGYFYGYMENGYR